MSDDFSKEFVERYKNKWSAHSRGRGVSWKDAYPQKAIVYAETAARGVSNTPSKITKAYKVWQELRTKHGFNSHRLAQACYLIERMESQGQPKLELQDWQIAFLSWIFGFYFEDGTRVVRNIHLVAPRNAGKTELCLRALLADFLLQPKKNGKQEGIIASVSFECSKVMYERLYRILKSSPEITKYYNLKVSKKRIESGLHGGVITLRSSTSLTTSGGKATFLYVDELSQIEDERLVDELNNFIGLSKNGLLLTASSYRPECQNTSVRRARNQALAWLEGSDSNQTIGLLYEPDEDDDLDSHSTWSKCQPSYFDFRMEGFYVDMHKRAAVYGEEQDFHTYNLCLYPISKEAYRLDTPYR